MLEEVFAVLIFTKAKESWIKTLDILIKQRNNGIFVPPVDGEVKEALESLLFSNGDPGKADRHLIFYIFLILA